MSKPIDITGKKFGRLTAIEVFGRDKKKNVIWLCECECGQETQIIASNLSRGLTQSCGCLKREQTIEMNTKHGYAKRFSRSPEYKIWLNMRKRCLDVKYRWYMNYGGRGITICKEWVDNFEQFFKDMGSKPSEEHSIDRIDVNGNYEPSNCRWVDATMQARNRRCKKGSKTGVKGVYPYSKDRYIADIRVNGKGIALGVFETLEAAAQARKRAEEKYWGTEI